MRALIYDPYLDTLGGGERYALSVAATLAKNDYQVSYAWPDRKIFAATRARFGLNFDPFAVEPAAYSLFQQPGHLLAKWRLTRSYDLIFWLSDGSVPFLFGRKNLVHFQVPFNQGLGGAYLIRLLKNRFIDYYVYNSEFTRQVVEPHLGYPRGVVLYPPVDTASTRAVKAKKEDLILSVARFDSPSHAKRHDLLIEAFKKIQLQFPQSRLVLAGGVKGEGGAEQIRLLTQKAGKLPVEFVVNPDFSELTKLYKKAKVFWHAAGYDIDEKLYPEQVEHFGITTVEAMAAGAVPVVINKGGQKEIVTPDSGCLWQTLDQLVAFTGNLLSDRGHWLHLSKGAQERAERFNLARFESQLLALIS